jgi:hypothetical protein
MPDLMKGSSRTGHEFSDSRVLTVLVMISRGIIGGAQIIDMAILFVDANKGSQCQTAECIIIGNSSDG